MSNLVNFPAHKTAKKAKIQTSNNFTAEVESDTAKLAGNLGITDDEAIKVAADFYQKYPMLVEYVRSTEYLLRGK